MSFFFSGNNSKEYNNDRHKPRPQLESTSPRGKTTDSYQSLYENEKAESNKCRSELKQTQNQLEDSQRQIQSLKDQIEKLQQQVKASNSQKEEGDKIINQLQTQNIQLKQAHTEIQEQHNRLGQLIHNILKNNFNIFQTTPEPEPKPILIPKPPSKLSVVVLETTSVDVDTLNAFKTHLTTLSDNLIISNEGVPLIVRAAITERVEQYFPKPLDPMCVPIALQRVAPPGGVRPNPIQDPFGNLVIVHFYSRGKSYSFSYPKGVEYFFQVVKQIAENQNV